MKTLCITGARHEILEPTFAVLRHAGMAAPRTIDRDPQITLALWQQRVLANHGARDGGVLRPGRLWEQLATDLFLANIDSPLWGWADPNSVQLLDFWAEFEPSVHFVLLCETPRQVVASLLTQPRSESTIAAALASWLAINQTLLRFHLRNPGRSVLLWADEAQADVAALLARLNQHWNLALDTVAAEVRSIESPPALAHYLAGDIAGHYPELQSLALELHASISPLNAGQGDAISPINLDAESLMASYRSLCDRSAELAAIETLTVQQRVAVEATADALAGISALRNEKEAQRAAADDKLKDAEHESELLLLQLHQVQEELESTFLKNGENETRLKTLKGEVDTAVKATADALAGISALRNEKEAQRAAADDKLKDAEHESELLLLQLHQVQEELESTFLKNGENETRLKTLKGEVDTAVKAKVDALARISVLEKAAQAIVVHPQVKEAEQENELLLLQLHQVQEELESYFLKNESAQRDLQTQKDRWERLFKTTPGLYNCDSIALRAVGEGGDTLAWRLTAVGAVGRVFDSLEFHTVIEQGVAGFIFERRTDGHDALVRWPVSARKDKTITVIPLRDGEDAQRRAAVLVQLASSDWGLLQTLTTLLTATVQGGRVQLPPATDEQRLLAALARSKQLMAGFKGLVRFDTVALVGQQKTPQREVLSMNLANLEYAEARLPALDFQVQASPGDSDFGQTMHLIFPESTAAAPFQSWLSNIKDTAGRPVLALRLTASGPDAAIWEKLDAGDHGFVTALIDSLAIFLVTLQGQGVRLERPWQDWVGVAGKLRAWVREPHKPQPEISVETDSDVLTVDASPELDLPVAVHASKPARKARPAKSVETRMSASAESAQSVKPAKPVVKPPPTAIKKAEPKAAAEKSVASKPKSRKITSVSA